jgi:Na+-exporting ATPase
MAVSFGTMDWISGGVIAALVILNVGVGSYTEWQAEKASVTRRFFPAANA